MIGITPQVTNELSVSEVELLILEQKWNNGNIITYIPYTSSRAFKYGKPLNNNGQVNSTQCKTKELI
jgi:hypothetical protein